MSKRNLDWNLNKLNRFLNEGRGQGEGKEYKPWLTIQDMPSIGRVSRIYSHKTKRIHHLFTDNETRVFYLLTWEDDIIDIREHYPLLKMDQVIKDKKGIHFEKFFTKETNTPFVFTTTFLIVYKDSNDKDCYIARSVKSALELEKKHVLERLEVERRFWESSGVNWGIITQKDINVIKAQNIQWVYSTIEDGTIDGEMKVELSNLLMTKLNDSVNNVRTITSKFDAHYNLDAGTGLYLFKYLIATKKIHVNMNEKININLPVKDVIVNI